MSCAGSWFGSGRFIRLLVRDLFFSRAAAADVIASVDQDSEGPSSETGLPAEACDAALDFQKCVLHRVFGVGGGAEQIARDAFHSGTVEAVKRFERAKIAGLACGRQSGIVRCVGQRIGWQIGG